MSGLPWWLWAIAAAVIGLAELHMPGSYLIWIGLGAAAAALAEFVFGLALAGQIETFLGAAVVSCALGYVVYRRLNAAASDKLNRRNLQLVGTKGVVCEPLLNGQGKVRLGDTVWLAEGPDLASGAAVVVKDVRGLRVVVEAAT